jgi:hypothetical protein
MNVDFDDPVLALREVLDLLAVSRGFVEGLKERGILTSRIQAGRGGGGHEAKRTYSLRDLLKMEAVAELVDIGMMPSLLTPIVKDGGTIDAAIEACKLKPRAKTIHPLVIIGRDTYSEEDCGIAKLSARMRELGQSAYAVFDREALIAKWTRRLAIYLEGRVQGIPKEELLVKALDGFDPSARYVAAKPFVTAAAKRRPKK